MVLVQDKELYINFVNEYVKHAQDAIATDLPPIKEYQGGNIYQVTAFSNEKESQLIMNIASIVSFFAGPPASDIVTS